MKDAINIFRWFCRGALIVSWVMAAAAKAQTTSTPTTNAPTAPAIEETKHDWSFSAVFNGYLVPHSRDYFNPNLAADYKWLHLEGRYNNEALDSGSLWFGYNFSFGNELVFDATPMVGGVFGSLRGVAPGSNLSLHWKGFVLSSQNEYVFDSEGSSGDFFYSWSEFTYSPCAWFRAGLAAQRTRAYQTKLDVQRGLMAGFTYKKLDFATYVFNFGWTDPTVVLAMSVTY
jgi:hypothetical protein